MLRFIFISIVLVYAHDQAFAQQTKFIFDHAVDVAQPSAEGTKEKQTVAAGAEVAFAQDKVYWVQAKGKVPLLVLPQISPDKTTPLRVQLPDVAAWPSSVVQQELDMKLGQLVSDLTAFQEALRKKNVDDAEKALNRMEQVARLDYLHFLRAALKFVQGDIEAAKNSTRRGLQRHPANEEGLKFLQRLEGGSR